MPAPSAAPEPWRCSWAARDRDDPLMATAPPARRLLLVEVPGPWGRVELADNRLDRYTTGRLADAAAAAGVRVLLVRRPGRHAIVPGVREERSWALVDVRPGRSGVTWGRWTSEHDLLDVDLRAEPAPAGPGAPAPRLALVCTHGRHDVCCALRGRPVAAALAAGSDWDVWECSHLGGDRFAANVLLLPHGELLGNLDPASAVAALRGVDGGRLDLRYYRGRLGRPPVEQAAVHLAMAALGEDRRDAVRVLAVTRAPEVDGEGWTVEVQAPAGRHRLTLATAWAAPDVLTCHAPSSSRARRFELLAVDGPASSGPAGQRSSGGAGSPSPSPSPGRATIPG